VKFAVRGEKAEPARAPFFLLPPLAHVLFPSETEESRGASVSCGYAQDRGEDRCYYRFLSSGLRSLGYPSGARIRNLLNQRSFYRKRAPSQKEHIWHFLADYKLAALLEVLIGHYGTP
jgi:hypothetical protein